MWEQVNVILEKIDDIVWGVPIMVLILSGGILLTLRLGLLQIRRLPLALKWMVKNEDDGTERLRPLVRYVRHFQPL